MMHSSNILIDNWGDNIVTLQFNSNSISIKSHRIPHQRCSLPTHLSKSPGDSTIFLVYYDDLPIDFTLSHLCRVL